jgi:predicted MFS family arabinose efflux permease
LVSPKGLAKLPLRYLLKNDLHLDAAVMATFFAVGWIAWYLKPFAGLVADSVRFRGTRRRHYLIVSAAASAVLWLLMPVAGGRYSAILFTVGVLNTFLMILSTVLGGYLVEEGRRYGATGRMSVGRSAASSVSDLLCGPIGGVLAERPFAWAAVISAALVGMLSAAFSRVVREPAVKATSSNPWGETTGKLHQQFQVLRSSRPLWAATGMIFLIYASPGFYTPLFYHQTDTLHFSSSFIGNLGVVSGGAAILGSLAYAWLCRRLSLRTLLILGIVAGSMGELIYLGYRSHIEAIWIEGLNGFCSALVTLSVFDLAARGTPKGCESMGYSLIMSLNNLAISLSDMLGAWLYSRCHIPFMSLVWINAITTALTLVVVPFLPRVLLQRRDGELENEPSSV